MPTSTKNKTALYISLAVILCILLIIIVFIAAVRVSAANNNEEFVAASTPKNAPNTTDTVYEKFFVVHFAGINVYINRDLPRNTFSADDFTLNEDGSLSYNGNNVVCGIDVSAFQDVIDWQAVKDSGVDFAIIRLGFRGMSAGQLYLDEQFYANIDGAADAGVDIGIYFFSQATSA